MKLRLKDVAEFARIVGATCRRDSAGDVVVAFGKGDARQTYFASDAIDALGTLRVMFGGHERIQDAEEYLRAECATKGGF